MKGRRLSSYKSLVVFGFFLLVLVLAFVAGPVSKGLTQSSAPPEEQTRPTSKRRVKLPHIILPLAPPSNDVCAGAEVIPSTSFPVLSSITADITDATTTGDPPTPSCQSNISRSIWYTFTPATTGFYQLSTCASGAAGSTVDDTVMAIYTSTGSCAGPFTELATTASTDGCDDDTCITEGLQSVISTTLNGGTTYYVLVWKFDIPVPTPGNTAVQVRVDQLPVVQNDTCATAVPLTLNIPVAASVPLNSVNDYQLAAASPCFPAGHTASTATGHDVVFSFTAPSAGQYSVRAWQFVSTGTSNVVVYTSSTCPAAVPGVPQTVSCLSAANLQSSTGGEEVNCVALSAGQQIFFFVDESTLGAGGNFYALVESCGAIETEPNNTPAQAGPLACGIQGQVNPATEADFYSIGTPAVDSRLFAMVDTSTAGTSADVDLRVNSATDTLEFDDLDLDVQFGVSGFAPSIAGFIATGAPLFYQVDRFGSAPTGIASPYRLYSVVQPPSTSATSESEPNDSAAAATSAVNNYFTGQLTGPSPSSDVDFYAFDAVAGDLIMVNLDGDPERNNTPVDTRLELLDTNGFTLVNVNGSAGVNTLDNANPPGLFESQPAFVSEALLFHAQTTGRYYVRVTAGSSSATTAAGNYLLSITRNCVIGGGSQPGAGPGEVIISEFRLRGPGGVNDEFVEIYNTKASAVIVNSSDGSAGWSVAASDGTVRFVIPNGTVIPAHGHFLGVNSSGYSLGGYAAGDATYTTDIPENVGIALFNNATPANLTLANRLDAVGSASEANTLYKEGTGYPAFTTSGIDYSLFRNMKNGSPKDTDNNFASGTAEPLGAVPQNDFVFADTAATSTAAGQRLGAPGPENMAGPIQRNASIGVSLVAPCMGSTIDPNRVRNGSGNSGSLEIRRRFTNNSGFPVTRLRFRVVDITTALAPGGIADLRAVTSSGATPAQPCGGGTITILGSNLETPPTQAIGGGFNSSLSAGTITLGTPLAPGSSVNLNFQLNILQIGGFRFYINIEALP